MPFTIARLRQGILILGGLLVAVLVGFLIYAHHRIRRFEKDLPARLGVNIQQTASGYTYSQSSKGHTLFTIHASKLIQYKQGGNATLHDVAITLYGPQGSNRVDRIYGADFSYDAKDQIVSAQGEVNIDLQGFGNDTGSEKNTIHVKTSGLVFNQKTGQADTTAHTEFAFPKASGSSTGAHYNSKTGVLVLDSNVALTTGSGIDAAVVHATHATMERDKDEAFLTNPTTDYRSEKGSSDAAVIVFRNSGSAQSIDATGNVRVVTVDGATVTAASAHTELDEKNQPTRTDLAGGVMFVSDARDAQMLGTARSGELLFGADSLLRHAQFRGGVDFVEQVSHLSGDPKATATRQMNAAKLDVDFVPGPNRKAIARQALATGNAIVHLRVMPSKGTPQLTTISGDQLLARMMPDGKTIRQLNGTGNTHFSSIDKDGSTSTSAGNTLEVTFAATQKSTGKSAKTQQTEQIETAVQDGNVMLTQTPARKPGAAAPVTMTAWAQHSEYHAADQVLHLSGSPRLEQGATLQISAAEIDYHRDSGDAVASGGVKATYNGSQGEGASPSGPMLNGNGPVHVTADHATLRRATGASTFYGANGTDARIWQAGDSILAPVIVLTRSPQTLEAHGMKSGEGAVVEANLMSANGANHHPSLMQVHSETLVYSDAKRRGDFHGSVTATDADGVIRANDALVYLTPATKPGEHPAKGRQSQLERIVATGHVVLTQPGRTGTGEQLVYTAANGNYVLTGTPGAPPRIVDAVKGATIGTKLIFNSQNDSVEVSGGQSSAVTETRAPK